VNNILIISLNYLPFAFWINIVI